MEGCVTGDISIQQSNKRRFAYCLFGEPCFALAIVSPRFCDPTRIAGEPRYETSVLHVVFAPVDEDRMVWPVCCWPLILEVEFLRSFICALHGVSAECFDC